MRAVLGIDAAWTDKNPSGVALVAESRAGWELIRVESSYQRFLAAATPGLKPESRPTGSKADVPEIIQVARTLCGGEINLVTVDMPMAHSKIIRRRTSDNAVSKAYGARNCSTHTPSAIRPDRISDDFRAAFEAAGFPLCTTQLRDPGLIEVYPHPALVELAQAPERLKYKWAKAGKFWPELDLDERRIKVNLERARIVELLEPEVRGVARALEGFEERTQTWELKETEEALDAVICAWVGICALDGRADFYGDEDSAIWIPKPR